MSGMDRSRNVNIGRSREKHFCSSISHGRMSVTRRSARVPRSRSPAMTSAIMGGRKRYTPANWKPMIA
jgi:hypothetical protein